MREIKTTHIPESYQFIKHSSGVEILLYPMEGFSSAYALFSTKYGSIDTTFKTEADSDFVKVPEGIAHFLEHKLFESEKGDAFARYAATGASANAYTSFDRTAYLFTCNDNFRQSLEILLDFVTDPYFTPETVEKEQGIIGQEIKMYQDDANWRVFFGMLNGLYQNNPVAIDIAGTVESISNIDDQLLYRCYNTFYNLNNMCIVIAGNFDPAEALGIADEILKPAPSIAIERQIPAEPESISQSYTEITLPIAQPMFMIGYKGHAGSEGDNFVDSIRVELLLDMLVGEASPLYLRLYEDGLINVSFGYSSDGGRGYFYSSFSGESREPQKVLDAIDLEFVAAKQNGLDPLAFEHCKRSLWGRYVSVYGSVTNVASMLLSSHFAGFDGYKVLDVVAETTLEDLTALLNKNFDSDKKVLSVVKPD